MRQRIELGGGIDVRQRDDQRRRLPATGTQHEVPDRTVPAPPQRCDGSTVAVAVAGGPLVPVHLCLAELGYSLSVSLSVPIRRVRDRWLRTTADQNVDTGLLTVRVLPRITTLSGNAGRPRSARDSPSEED